MALENFKDEVIKLIDEFEKFNNMIKPYGLSPAASIFNFGNLKRMLNTFNYRTDEQIINAIDSIVEYIPQKQLNNLIGITERLFDSRKVSEKLEKILIDEMLKRKAHTKLRDIYLYGSINKACERYITNNLLDIFFKCTNNDADIIVLFEKIVQITDYKDEYFDKFNKVLNNKLNNFKFKKEKMISYFENIEPFIKEKHMDSFNSLHLMIKLS